MDNKETDKSQMNGSMKDMNQLHLEKITYLNWHDVEDLRLTKEQKNYLPDNVSNLALAGVIREAGFHVFTFGIYLGEKPIGFVMIGYDIPLDPEDDLNEKYWFTRDSYFIWRFMIDKRYQRKGYGKQALELILDFIRSGPCRKAKYAWLCYANENEVARRMYAGFGFEEVPEAYDEDDGEMPAVLKLGVHYLCIIADNPVSRFINGNTAAFVLYGIIMAGVFEECGRYIVLKTIMKKNRTRENAVLYGIGHGGNRDTGYCSSLDDHISCRGDTVFCGRY